MVESSQHKLRRWRTLSRDVVFEHPWLVVEQHNVQIPNGRVIHGWPWALCPDYVTIAALTTDLRFICFRQTKYLLEEPTLAPPGGYLNPGETPLAAAKRELLEETCYEAKDWTPLLSCRVDANRGFGTGNFFLARDCSKKTDALAGDLEDQHLLLLTRAELENALWKGDFKVMSWVATLALALNRLDHEAPVDV